MSDDLINLGEVLTPKARMQATKGQVYGFKKDSGDIVHYKVIRISKTFRNVWATKVDLLTGEEMDKIWEAKRNGKN